MDGLPDNAFFSLKNGTDSLDPANSFSSIFLNSSKIKSKKELLLSA